MKKEIIYCDENINMSNRKEASAGMIKKVVKRSDNISVLRPPEIT